MTATVQQTRTRALPEDFERIFRSHHDLVYRVAYRITGNSQDAEDVLQTLFLRLLRRERPLDLDKNPKGYLHRAAVNIALDVIKVRKRNVGADGVEAVDDRRSQATELQSMLRSALSELSPRLAEMFVLKYVEGYGNAEIAKLIGTSRGSVAVLLFRARARLKKSIRAQMRADRVDPKIKRGEKSHDA